MNIFQRDFKFVVEYGEPVGIRAFTTDGAIRKFLQMGWVVGDILAIECYK